VPQNKPALPLGIGLGPGLKDAESRTTLPELTHLNEYLMPPPHHHHPPTSIPQKSSVGLQSLKIQNPKFLWLSKNASVLKAACNDVGSRLFQQQHRHPASNVANVYLNYYMRDAMAQRDARAYMALVDCPAFLQAVADGNSGAIEEFHNDGVGRLNKVKRILRSYPESLSLQGR
jgi:hypothetical protein